MAHIADCHALLCIIIIIILSALCKVSSGTSFTIVNKCDYTVWPGILSSSGSATLQSTGFQLQTGASTTIQVPQGWSGRLWGRTRCNFDPNSGQGSCATADCGSGQIQCNGAGAIPPATLAEFTIGSGSGVQDFYDVSLVDGYNLPMLVVPNGGSGSCELTGCAADLNEQCPSELRVGEGNACNSACGAFDTDEYCCRGAYASPETCKPSIYSQTFKALCPRSYSYAFDDRTSTFTCAGADYTITFCPAVASQKSSREMTPPPPPSEAAVSGSGSGNGPTVVTGADGNDGSWLSNILFSGGGSLSKLGWQLTAFALATSFLTLHRICL